MLPTSREASAAGRLRPNALVVTEPINSRTFGDYWPLIRVPFVPRSIFFGDFRPLQNYSRFLKIQPRIAWVELAWVSIA